jgi:hypothetical protein
MLVMSYRLNQSGSRLQTQVLDHFKTFFMPVDSLFHSETIFQLGLPRKFNLIFNFRVRQLSSALFDYSMQR